MPEADEDAAFAERVITLYRAALEGTSDRHPENDRKVRSVAFGLAAITQAIDDRKAKYQHDQLRLVQAGVFQASDIIAAITTGQGHPIWRFISGLKSGRYRPGKARGVDIGQRERFGAIALAYQAATGVSEREAATKVAKGIKWEDHQFKPDQIRTWIKRNRPACEQLSQEILANAGSLSAHDPLAERVLIVGRTSIFHSSASIPAARR